MWSKDRYYEKRRGSGYYRNERNERIRDNKPQVDFWKKIKKVAYSEREIGRFYLKFSMEISRPVFMDGSEGFFQLSTMIKINDHYIRLSPSVLIELMDILSEKREHILEAINDVREQNEIIRESQKETEQKAREKIESGRYRRSRSHGHYRDSGYHDDYRID